MKHVGGLPYDVAAVLTLSEPNKAIIWAKAVISSLALKNGYRPDNIDKKITPADQISTAEV